MFQSRNVKEVRLKQRSEPWITHDILEPIKERYTFILELNAQIRNVLMNNSVKLEFLYKIKLKKLNIIFIMSSLKNVKGIRSAMENLEVYWSVQKYIWLFQN